MTQSERQILIERTTSAWRPRDRDGGVRAHAAWHDLDEPSRTEAYQATLALRKMEAALDSEGLSTTARAVLARIRPGA